MAKMQKITPNLWFDTEGEEAANFYTSIFGLHQSLSPELSPEIHSG